MKNMSSKQVQKLLALHPEALIRVYSFQGDEAMAFYNQNGYLTGDKEYIETGDLWPEPYTWMRKQMAEKIEDFSGDYPVWGWLKRPSAKPKPKKYRGTNERYRFIALVPRKRILLSDYELWHSPLNGSQISLTETEFDNFVGDPEPTWGRIFEFPLELTPDQKYWLGVPEKVRVQACIDRIYASEVVSIREFL